MTKKEHMKKYNLVKYYEFVELAIWKKRSGYHYMAKFKDRKVKRISKRDFEIYENRWKNDYGFIMIGGIEK